MKAYTFPVILVSAILLGGFTGYYFGPKAHWLKPFGDVFLNLIFTAMVPLIFFSVASATSQIGSLGKTTRIMGTMGLVFLFTGLVTAIYGLIVVKLFPPAVGFNLPTLMPEKIAPINVYDQIAAIFTVSDFSKLLSHEHILALIVFSLLVGLAINASGEQAKPFKTFLQAGTEVFMRVFGLIMYYAPLGFFAYFAVLIGDLGSKLMEGYLRIGILYSLSGLLYFGLGFTAYAYLAGKGAGVRLFWANILLPLLTSLATCSSAASIPANLAATKKMGVPAEIYETAIPLGSIIHKDGSVLGGMFKIAFLFGVFHLDFTGFSVLATAIGVSLLVGTIMGAIPSGGMLGEMLILNVYGFPPSSLILVAVISIIVDPIATMINVTGNSVSSMLIARLMNANAENRAATLRERNS